MECLHHAQLQLLAARGECRPFIASSDFSREAKIQTFMMNSWFFFMLWTNFKLLKLSEDQTKHICWLTTAQKTCLELLLWNLRCSGVSDAVIVTLLITDRQRGQEWAKESLLCKASHRERPRVQAGNLKGTDSLVTISWFGYRILASVKPSWKMHLFWIIRLSVLLVPGWKDQTASFKGHVMVLPYLFKEETSLPLAPDTGNLRQDWTRPWGRDHGWWITLAEGLNMDMRSPHIPHFTSMLKASFYLSHWPVLPLQKGSGTKFRMAQCQILPPPFAGCVALGKRQLWNLHL